jgi:hypothetical protein
LHTPSEPSGLRARLTHAPGREGVARALLVLAAGLSFGLSVVLYFSGNEDAGIFVGIWVPSILALGALLVPRRAADHGGS